MNPEISFPNLGISIQHLDRVAFSIFGLPIYWYGIIIVSSILIAIAFVGYEARRTGQDPEWYYDLAIYCITGAIIGARVYYVVFSWESYKDNLIKIFHLREGGLAIYGGVIGGALAVAIYTKIKKHNFFLFADTITPALILAQATGRWGNFINREAFGGVSENLFAMRYLASTVSYIPASVMENIVTFNGASYIQVHPTFLYESIWNLAGFAVLLFLAKKKKYNGQIAAFYFIIYGFGRVWIEGLRTDQLQIGSTGIAISQVLSGALIIVSAVFLFINRNRAELTLAPTAGKEATADSIENGGVTDEAADNIENNCEAGN